MTIRNILCTYVGEASRGSELKHAVKIANHHAAWLTGVIRIEASELENRFSDQLPDSVLENLRSAEMTQTQEISDLFSEIVSEGGLADRSEFVRMDARDSMSLPEFARVFDLVISGVHSNAAHEMHFSANPDLIALRSGRPVLIVPDGYEAPGLAEHALVAWDGKRSAARAIGDAMPILEEKAKVSVLTVGSGPVPGTDRLLENLQRHGIVAELVQQPRSGRISQTILDCASKREADLIVMGAFEHSKFSHDLVGGVTTEVIRDTQVPVFLSH